MAINNNRLVCKSLKTGKRTSMQKLIEAAVQIMESPPEGDQIAFLHAAFCQVGLPRSKPKTDRFERRSGNVSIVIESGELWNGKRWEKFSLPYGTRPRLLNLHITREYLRTKNRCINLGNSISGFLTSQLGIGSQGGSHGPLTAFRNQALALAAATLRIGYNGNIGPRTIKTQPIEEFQAWLAHEEGQKTLWPGQLILSERYAEAIEEFSVPLDARAVRAIQDSALALDVYAWLAHRLHRLNKPLLLPWKPLNEQFGQEYTDPKNFKREMLRLLPEVMTVYPEAKVERVTGGLLLKPSRPPVSKIQIAFP